MIVGVENSSVVGSFISNVRRIGPIAMNASRVTHRPMNHVVHMLRLRLVDVCSR